MSKINSHVYTALFASLIAVGSFIKLPLLLVPFTLQTLFVMLNLLIMKRSAVKSVVLYLAAGLLGLPVFAYGGGLAYLFQPTFGFLIGFMMSNFIIGYAYKQIKHDLLCCLLAMLIIYGCGLIYFVCLSYIEGKIYTLMEVFSILILPFVLNDILSCYVACMIKKRLDQANLGVYC